MRPLPLQLVQLIFPGYVPLTKQESPKKKVTKREFQQMENLKYFLSDTEVLKRLPL